MAEDYDEDDDERIQSLTDYSPKSEFSKALLIQQSFSKTREARGKEMIEGYYNYKFDKNGNEIKTWIPDARQIYCANVDGDINLLAPEIQNNDETLAAFDDFEVLKKNLFKKYIYKEKTKTKLKDNTVGWAYTGKEYMPKIGEALPINNPKYPQSAQMLNFQGLWDKNVNLYWDEMVMIYDMIWRELNILVHDLNYFKAGSRYG